MQKVLFFTKSVSILGGKEKVLTGLANYLAEGLYRVEIITYDGHTEAAFKINASVKISTIPLSSLSSRVNPVSKILSFIKDIRTYRRLKNTDADFIIATDQIIATIVYYALKKKKRSIIIWEHLSYAAHVSTIWNFFRRHIYPRIKLVVTLNKEEAEYYKAWACHVACIPNGVAQNASAGDHPLGKLVWAGALTYDKGIDDVIELAKMLKQNGQQIKLNVFGTGTGAVDFANRIAQQSVDDIINLQKPVTDTAYIYTTASALLVTSKHECFPTIILEAFSFGIPTIAYDCPTGPRNIITNNINGFLIPQGNVKLLYNAVVNLVQNYSLLNKMGNAAYSTSQDFTPEKMYSNWVAVLQ